MIKSWRCGSRTAEFSLQTVQLQVPQSRITEWPLLYTCSLAVSAVLSLWVRPRTIKVSLPEKKYLALLHNFNVRIPGRESLGTRLPDYEHVQWLVSYPGNIGLFLYMAWIQGWFTDITLCSEPFGFYQYSFADTWEKHCFQCIQTSNLLVRPFIDLEWDSALSWLWLFVVVGLLNPLDCPHHVRMEERSLYREGVVLDRPSGKKKKGSYADCGMRKVNFC